MLPRKNRLRKKKEIEEVLKKGKKISGYFFSLYFLKNQLPFSRAAFSVSKKISNKAFQRNKIKRWLREFFRQEFFSEERKVNLDILVIVQKNFLKNNSHLAKEEIRKILNNLNYES